jgi:hypothetical protein
MPYTIKTGEPILHITLLGTLTNEDLAALAREAMDLERSLAVVPHRLTDTRPATRLEITFDGILDFANKRMQLKFPNSFKSAIVASDVVRFGFARMFQTLNDHPQISIAIFPDTPTALHWLEQPGHDLPGKAWAPRVGVTG